MFHSSLIQKLLFALLVMALCIPLCGTALADDGIPEEADTAFWNMLHELEEDRLITLDGNSTYYGDYEKEWAQLGWYSWLNFENADRFVFSSNLSWDSASDKPNNFESGCGVVFNQSKNTSDHLLASLRMDGLVYFTGTRNKQYLSYGTYSYGKPSIKNSVNFVLLVDHDKATVYVDGRRVVQKANLLVMGNTVGLSTLSGTNKGFGTRCEWKDIFFYTW